MAAADPVITSPMPRSAYLRVPADRSTSGYEATATLLARVNSTEGLIVLDDSARVREVRVLGGFKTHELTVNLRPGWKPDAYWDDVDPARIAAAVALMEGDE